ERSGGQRRPLLPLLRRAGEERRTRQVVGGEGEDVALVRQDARVEEGSRGLVAETLDVEGASSGHVEDALHQLGRAGLVVGAAAVLVARLLLDQLGAAGRA